MATAPQKHIVHRTTASPRHILTARIDKISEWFWFLLSFLLFVVLGPFSAPVVILVLCRLGFQDCNHIEPETVSCR